MKKLLLLSIFILLWSCNFDIPPVKHHFYNQSAATVTVTPNPDTGEDWLEFTLAPGTDMVIESVDTSIWFVDPVGVQWVSQTTEPSLPPYTYIFYDIDTGWTVP